MGSQGNDKFVDFSFEKAVETMQSETHAMVGDPILGKVVRAHPFAPISASHLTLPIFGNFIPLLLDQLIQQAVKLRG
jgi:hypothetical protein